MKPTGHVYENSIFTDVDDDKNKIHSYEFSHSYHKYLIIILNPLYKTFKNCLPDT